MTRLSRFLSTGQTELHVPAEPPSAPKNRTSEFFRKATLGAVLVAQIMAAAAPLSPAKAADLGDQHRAQHTAQHTASASQLSAQDPVRVDLVNKTNQAWSPYGDLVLDPGDQSRMAKKGLLITDANELELATRTINKYIVHGHAPVDRTVYVSNRFDSKTNYHPEVDKNGQFILQHGSDCHIVNIANDYSQVGRDMFVISNEDDGGAVWVDTPLIRAGILIHEDAHCRVVPFLGLESSNRRANDAVLNFDFRASDDHRLAWTVKSIVTENISDAAALLMISRRDGLDAALDFGSTLRAIRAREEGVSRLGTAEKITASMLEDKSVRIGTMRRHSTVTSIDAVIEHLKSHGVPSSDFEAWETSVRMGTENGIRAAQIEITRAKVNFFSRSIGEQTSFDINNAARLSIEAYVNADIRPDPDGQEAFKRIETSGLSMTAHGGIGARQMEPHAPGVQKGPSAKEKPPVTHPGVAPHPTVQELSSELQASNERSHSAAQRITSMLLKPSVQKQERSVRPGR